MAVSKILNFSFQLSNGILSGSLNASATETGSGADFLANPQTLTAGAWTAISIGACASPDLLAVKNEDATNYVQLALANDGTKIFARLTPKRMMFVPVEPGATIYARANTGNCLVSVAVAEP